LTVRELIGGICCSFSKSRTWVGARVTKFGERLRRAAWCASQRTNRDWWLRDEHLPTVSITQLSTTWWLTPSISAGGSEAESARDCGRGCPCGEYYWLPAVKFSPFTGDWASSPMTM